MFLLEVASNHKMCFIKGNLKFRSRVWSISGPPQDKICHVLIHLCPQLFFLSKETWKSLDWHIQEKTCNKNFKWDMKLKKEMSTSHRFPSWRYTVILKKWVIKSEAVFLHLFSKPFKTRTKIIITRGSNPSLGTLFINFPSHHCLCCPDINNIILIKIITGSIIIISKYESLNIYQN